jgi:predicted dehydrogenase
MGMPARACGLASQSCSLRPTLRHVEAQTRTSATPAATTPQTGSLGVGVIGCGNISGIYLDSMNRYGGLHLVRTADVDLRRARSQAARYKAPRAGSLDELLDDDDVQIAIDLTPPAEHGPVGRAVLEAGKSLYNEKPLATTREQALALRDVAAQRGLRVGGAPDSFMGAGQQTLRAAIDDGSIGRPIGALAISIRSGPDNWHPNPDFFYQPGAGPLFDIGPYYVTALVALLGPVRRVAGLATIGRKDRPILGGPNAGRTIRVSTPTHVTALLDFVEGPVVSLMLTFDVASSGVSDVLGTAAPRFEIYGTEGTLTVEDPTSFDGPVRLFRSTRETWSDLPLVSGFTEHSDRGMGVADMAHAIRAARRHRASWELAYHVLDVMLAISEAAESGRYIDMESRCERPEPLDPRWPANEAWPPAGAARSSEAAVR